jgi:7-cyano-7-deazaguanine reductase
MEPKYLGRRVTQPIEDLDTFAAPAGLSEVRMCSDELTCNCPVTGQPDYYTLEISYRPDRLCIESKSLKLYLWHFRDQARFCEALAVDIRDRIMSAVAPRSCRVRLMQKARGGISIEARSEYPEAGDGARHD